MSLLSYSRQIQNKSVCKWTLEVDGDAVWGVGGVSPPVCLASLSGSSAKIPVITERKKGGGQPVFSDTLSPPDVLSRFVENVDLQCELF